jgi:hypothetical protein
LCATKKSAAVAEQNYPSQLHSSELEKARPAAQPGVLVLMLVKRPAYFQSTEKLLRQDI